MAFDNVMSAYNCFKNAPLKTLEARAQAINADIAGNPNADFNAYAIELEGIERAIEERGQSVPTVTVPEVAKTASTEKREDMAASPEYRSAFYKHLMGRELTEAERVAFKSVNVEHRASEFNTLSNAAAVIPTTTLDEILVKARKQGGLMSVARAFSVPSNISIPVATPGAAAQWHVEGAEVESGKASTVPVKFEGFELMRVLSLSAATQSMSISAFESYLVDELNASITSALAAAMIDGTGEGQATGIITGITWTENTNLLTVGADTPLGFTDILDCISMLPRGYGKDAKFVMSNRTLYRDVYGIADEVNRPVYLADMTAEGKGRVLGFDVVIDDFLDDHEILFGDFRYFGYNLPCGIALDVSRESSFKSGLIDYRALAIADAKPIVPEAFVRITKATETTEPTDEQNTEVIGG